MDTSKFLENIRKELDSQDISYIRIKVKPNSPKTFFTEVLGIEEELTIKMNIKAPPTKGLANKEIIKFLSKEFNCQTEIISGHKNSLKLIKLFKN